MAAHIGQLIPLVILVLFVSAGAWIGYQIYLSVGKMRETASEKMNKKNVVFTKDGMRVGVRQKTNESYVDSTQKYVVKAWNLGKAKEAGSAISDS
ncbi:hypothetical protein HJFPF1_12905 [Paramyrothecium foliicola]|nr:hypothetical protein HJFPF1_12905 [Paramyrothecium foliicola]